MQENWGWMLAAASIVASFVALQFKMYYTLINIDKTLEILVPRVNKLDKRLSTLEGREMVEIR